MENIYFSQKIEQQLPEWVLYQLWYILNDYGCFRDERQECLLYLWNGQQCLYIVQSEPPAGVVMFFRAEQPVSAYRDTASGRAGRYDARGRGRG